MIGWGEVPAINTTGYASLSLDVYANMHTAKFPGGEIRGQVVPRHGDED